MALSKVNTTPRQLISHSVSSFHSVVLSDSITVPYSTPGCIKHSCTLSHVQYAISVDILKGI